MVEASTKPAVVVRYIGFLAAPALTDLVVGLGPSSPSSFERNVPGWLEEFVSGQCPGVRCLREFAGWESNRLVVNCRVESECRVATAPRSWGSVKASF
jgi:hypothetical protein